MYPLRNTKKYFSAGVIAALLLFAGCKAEPKPIAYGSDPCHFCRMTIVDKQHAAEIVTHKGKVYKFDAVECMLNFLKDSEEPSIALFMVNGYNNPGELLDATQAAYLVSESIPSPMGEYLTAFETIANAREVRDAHGGQLYVWEEIRNRFKD
jgi:copper chaperone NosL